MVQMRVKICHENTGGGDKVKSCGLKRPASYSYILGTKQPQIDLVQHPLQKIEDNQFYQLSTDLKKLLSV